MLSMLLTTLLPALLPVAIDGAKGVINKITDNANALPSNFGEFLQLQEFQLKKLELMARLDQPAGQISMWVADLRASIRYLAVCFILVVWGAITALNLPLDTQEYELLANLAQSAFFFLFGERVYMGLKKA